MYRDLDWTEIAFKYSSLDYFIRSKKSEKNAFVATWVLEIENLEYLIRALPDWYFHIASPVYCASALTKLSIYKNVTIYQKIIHKRI